MKTNPTLIIILAVLLFTAGFCTRMQFEKSDTFQSDTVRTETTHIVKVTDTIYKYVPQWQTTTVHDTIIDSANCNQIASLYFGKTFVIDTLFNDSTLFLAINDVLHQNKILGREIEIKRFDRIVTIETTVNNYIQKRYTTFATAGASHEFRNQRQNLYLGVGIMGKKQGVTAEYGVDNSLKINVLWKF
jgi:hypothetical protein